ncbi:MAG: hypothetical protein MUC29_08415, partial [Pyrinomonadaceae bacterium]|nr:hypothetical protein [Pyrinomonadaceae bacterium]
MKTHYNKAIFTLIISLIIGIGTAQAATFRSITTGNWGNAATWTIDAGTDADGIPDADDTVNISNHTVTVLGNQSVLILSVPTASPTPTLTIGSGAILTVNAGSIASNGTVNGSGKISLTGSTNINITAGTFTAPIEITSGTTTLINNSSDIGSPMTILNGATFSHGFVGFNHSGTMTINAGGTLVNAGGIYNFSGTSLVNNGTITSPGNVRFVRAGTQNISGTGTFTGIYRVFSGSTTNLAGNITIGNGSTSTSIINDSGGILDVLTHTLTANAVAFSSSGNYNSTTGKVRTQGATTFNVTNFNAPLEVAANTTSLANPSTFTNSITILSSATLSHGFQVLTHSGDLTINSGGTLNNSTNVYAFSGENLINNGTINSPGEVRFSRAGTQNISGTGQFIGDFVVLIGSTVNLNSNVTFGNGSGSSLTVNSGGTFAVGGFTLTADGVAISGLGAFTSSALGKISTDGTSSLSVTAAFTGSLEVSGGTTSLLASTISGSITVLNSATLSHSTQGITHSGNLTINAGGTLTNTTANYVFSGASLVNNGTITSPGEFRFAGTGQNLSGSGAMTGDATILNASIVTLGSNHQMENLLVNSGGILNTATFMLGLSGAGTPLS